MVEVRTYVYGRHVDLQVSPADWHQAETGDSIACRIDPETRVIGSLLFIGRNGIDKRFGR
ncbi:MAG: hypothetical protein HYY50_01750 [Candidatus Kerfeldbacteria bacterium]|nr:hypothetical protein [Candidatus Kerfeldbacteria bacterium]